MKTPNVKPIILGIGTLFAASYAGLALADVDEDVLEAVPLADAKIQITGSDEGGEGECGEGECGEGECGEGECGEGECGEGECGEDDGGDGDEDSDEEDSEE